ncbi:MAG: hypothetical protein AAGI01_05325 [Myxococcota bacterium]
MRYTIQTSLILGVQFDEFDLRYFLREYHRELRHRAPAQGFPAYSSETLLNSVIERHDVVCRDHPYGGRYMALRDYAQSAHRLHLCLTGSDYGAFERRESPYGFDRCAYHLGRELAQASLTVSGPERNPYRSTREFDIPFVREHIDRILEFLPDYVWWAVHDKRDMLRNILAPEKLNEVRRRIETTGFKTEQFGLYLTNFELLEVDPDTR